MAGLRRIWTHHLALGLGGAVACVARTWPHRRQRQLRLLVDRADGGHHGEPMRPIIRGYEARDRVGHAQAPGPTRPPQEVVARIMVEVVSPQVADRYEPEVLGNPEKRLLDQR